MAFEDCIAEIQAAAKRELSDEEIEGIAVQLDRIRGSRNREGRFESLEEELLKAADEMKREAVEAARIEKRNNLINVKKEIELKAFAEQVDKISGDPSLALEARLVGTNKRIPEARLSVDATGNALFTEYAGGLVADLKKGDLLVKFNSNDLERPIAQELAEITKKDGNIGVSGSKDAVAIAKIVDKYRKVAVARENRAGAWIKPLDGYITRQSHDMARIRRAGFDEWRGTILPLLDDATFARFDGDIVDDGADKFLRAAYDGLVTGNHLKSNGGGETDLKFAFKGPGNLAKRVSQHRVLHFKDADSWLKYNESFGQNSLTESIIVDLERAARNTALMEAFGTNPRAMYDRVLDGLKDKHRGDVKKFDRLKRRELGWFMDQVEGVLSISDNPSASGVGATVRSIQSMARLGGATISATADLPFKASELRFQGRSMLDSYGATLNSLVSGFSRDADKRRVSDLIGVGLNGQIGDLSARFNSTDNIPGKFAKAQQLFFKLNLLAPWTDANKRGVGRLMARDLAMKKAAGWDELSPRKRNVLSQFGIDGVKWDILRKAVRTEADGVEYLMPDAIRDLPDEAFAPLLKSDTQGNLRESKADVRRVKEKVQRVKDELETAVRSYYTDRTDFAVPTPSGKEQAYLKFGTRPGTPLGEAVRYIMQFKAFPVTAISKPFSREVFGQGAFSFKDAMLNGQADFVGIANLMVGTTVMGYLAQSAKELVKGRTPRDTSDPATWVAAMLQGGGLGLYGDFLFGQSDRFGRDLLGSLAGPTLGTVSDLQKAFAKLIAGDDFGSDILRITKDNTPFINLFYTRIVLDYLFLYQLQESVNPGYLRRMERNIKKENNQTFIVPPSSKIPRGGGNKLFEGVR